MSYEQPLANKNKKNGEAQSCLLMAEATLYSC